MVEKPIFIVGVGRSGSIAFHEMLSEHPQVTWLSPLCNLCPQNFFLNRLLMRTIDCPLAGTYLKRKIKKSEGYKFWEFHCKGFSAPCRDLLAEDLTDKVRAKIQKIMSAMLTNKRNRLLIKVTGWPRIGFLQAIFEDAKFIHIVRDGRAVANSMINVGWWRGWQGPESWRWGELTPSQRQEWEKYGKSFLALAGIEWKILMDAMDKAKGSIDSNNFLEVKYENLCCDSVQVLKGVLKFCNLEWSEKFEKSIRRHPLENKNYKWQKELTNQQRCILEDVLGDYLKKYGYV